jgi:hypothetical protein
MGEKERSQKKTKGIAASEITPARGSRENLF